MRQHEFVARRRGRAISLMLGPYTDVKFELLITTYEIAVQDTNYLAKPWKVSLICIALNECKHLFA